MTQHLPDSRYAAMRLAVALALMTIGRNPMSVIAVVLPAGSPASFAPLGADTSLWWVRRRGIAVGVCASGNYVAGAIWPPIVQHFVETVGWRHTYLGLAAICIVTMPPLALLLRARPPV